MKLFGIRGGVHPDGRKKLSKDRPIETIAMPARLHLPLQQHIGAHAEPEVERGDKVLKGQVLARAKGRISAPIHAPTSGTILGIHSFPAAHASGLTWQTITMEPDGADRWANLPPTMIASKSAPEEISQRAAVCGIVGMGGATFPAAVKLNLGDDNSLDRLIINGSECEPYLTCDDRLMREKAEGVVDGARIMAFGLKTRDIIIAIERNKPEAYKEIKAVTDRFENVSVVAVPNHYPMGAEKQLVQTLIGEETPAGKLTADIGVVVHNVATSYAVHDAVRYGRPLISRVVTVSGGAVANPKNILAPIGTRVKNLLDHCGGLTEEPETVLVGGPMMGQPVENFRAPILKGTNGVLALTKAETRRRNIMPCIRCASCVQACPSGLLPLEMAARIKKDELDKAVSLGLMDCISCGACSYICPSHIPLVQYFNYAKGRLKVLHEKQTKQDLTKKLTRLRDIRLEQQAAEKKALLAKKKAEQAALALEKGAGDE